MRQCATITIGDVMKKKIRVCENSMVLVYILAMSGGFMDAYSYMCRGEVFANAQTGNILLMAVNLAKGNFVVALRYFAPVMAFIAGVVLAQTVHHIFKGRALHRRQIVILFEAAALFAAAFIPYELNILCNCIISLACGTGRGIQKDKHKRRISAELRLRHHNVYRQYENSGFIYMRICRS